MARKRAHVWVSGEVQGVFFRDSTRAEAGRAGVRGWVRNLPDGRVEAVFEGEEPAVRRLVTWSYQGPRQARVEQVEVRWEEPTGEDVAFIIRGW